MQYREYRTINKSSWGDGAWQTEPDKVQFKDEATGLPCLIVRVPHSGHLCGYVGVAEGHNLYGKDYDDVKRADGEYIDAHGGLTFANKCRPSESEDRGICHVPDPGEPDHVWWFGFDCAHLGDLSPCRASRDRNRFDEFESYKTIEFVKAEIRKLAQQLAEAE